MRAALQRLELPVAVSAALPFVYLAAVFGLLYRIALLDDWQPVRWIVLAAFVATLGPDLVRNAPPRQLAFGVSFFAALTWSVAYLPNLWFWIAYQLHHGQTYFWHANDFMRSLPYNDAAFLWGVEIPWLQRAMQWIYIAGFDMVLWIPAVRALCAFDAPKMARYALCAHLVQFPLIMPFFASIRVDEVWSVLGHPDRLERGWTDAQRLDIGANCFPSMHTSVAFAVLLLALREKSGLFRYAMAAYSASIIFSTMYMEVHWLVDVLAGLVLGYATVKLVDRFWPKLSAPAAAHAAPAA